MKICDLTQFYSPFSGGVKRYVGEKVHFLRAHTSGDEHILIIPGESDDCIEGDRSRTYSIASPLISRTSRYRVLLRLEAIERILERERPDVIECGDPYQVAWKAVHSGAALGIPVVGFYHSHFPEAYVRTVRKYLGETITEGFMDFARRYVRSLYGRFERTIVPSPALAKVLVDWGLPEEKLFHSDLGVDTSVFRPEREPGEDARAELGIPLEKTLLLYVGRLAQEKNTQTLFSAFSEVVRSAPEFHLLVVGDGLQRQELGELQTGLPTSVTHLSYCDDSRQLARLYRAADLFVHPGVQETFGLVTLEAQACGTPVIGIRGSYMDRIIQSDQTTWARENTPQALAEAILLGAAVHASDDPLELHRRIAGKYSWEHIFGRLFVLYREVIAQYRRP